MLKWVLIVLAALVGLVLLMAVIGLMLPRDHTASASITLPQPPDSVWAVIRDFESYPEWWTDVKSMERLPDVNGHETWMQRDKHNQSLPIEIVTDRPPELLVTRIASDKLPFGGTWTYRIATAPEGSILTITEDGSIYNPIFRFMARFVFGYRRTIQSYVGALGGNKQVRE